MECKRKTNCVFNLACKGGNEFETSQGGHPHKGWISSYYITGYIHQDLLQVPSP